MIKSSYGYGPSTSEPQDRFREQDQYDARREALTQEFSEDSTRVGEAIANAEDGHAEIYTLAWRMLAAINDEQLLSAARDARNMLHHMVRNYADEVHKAKARKNLWGGIEDDES